MGKKSAPKPPDPVSTAAAQGAVNKETAITQAGLNRMNEYTPYGSVRYGQIPGTNENSPAQYERKIRLSPQQQALLNQENARNLQIGNVAKTQLSNIGRSINQPLSYDSAPEVTGPTANQFDAGARERFSDSVMDSYKRRLDPAFQDRETALDVKLANQGITKGSEAYDREQRNFSLDRNDAYGQAARNAYQEGGLEQARQGSEQSRLFGLEMGNRQQAINELMALRNQPINEFAAMTGLSGGVSTPQFANPAQVGVAAPDIAGQVNSNYQTQQQRSNAGQGGLFGLGGAIAGALPWGSWFSDINLKKNIKRIGKYNDKLDQYTWEWNDKAKAIGCQHMPIIGVIAQEAMKVSPDAVSRRNGYLMVDYSRL